MPINIPDTFISKGTALIDGGGQIEITTGISALPGILVSRVSDVVTLSQVDLNRKESTAITNELLSTTPGQFSKQGIWLRDWAYGDESGATLAQGKVAYWDATNGIWTQASASSENASLLLAMCNVNDTSQFMCKRGVVRTTEDFSSVPIGSPIYLGVDGVVVASPPSTENQYIRLLGWSLDQQNPGKMFFSPDVHYTIAS